MVPRPYRAAPRRRGARGVLSARRHAQSHPPRRSSQRSPRSHGSPPKSSRSRRCARHTSCLRSPGAIAHGSISTRRHSTSRRSKRPLSSRRSLSRCTGSPAARSRSPPRDDLGHAANYLYMIAGREPTPERVRALEKYLISTIDHGFNASTFTARVVTSTGADLGVGGGRRDRRALGPLHGGAPSRVLDMLDAIGEPTTPSRGCAPRSSAATSSWASATASTRPTTRARHARGGRRRARRRPARARRARRGDRASVLAELKPGRPLYTNVEFYAGIVMDAVGLPRELFTPTFAVEPRDRLVRARPRAGADNRSSARAPTTSGRSRVDCQGYISGSSPSSL